MTIKAKREPVTSVPFKPVPPNTAVNCIVELWVIPKPSRNDSLKLLFRQRLADDDSMIKDPNLNYKKDNPDVFVMERGTTLFNIYLKEDSGYVFRDPGLALSSKVKKNHRKYYSGWNKTWGPRHVAFVARHINALKAYHHPFLFFIENGKGHIYSGPIDPDVLNPGDHPSHVRISNWNSTLFRLKR
jgi:hypothetical protein